MKTPNHPLNISEWRKAERRHLIAARLSINRSDSAQLSEKIIGHLSAHLGDLRGRVVSGYWPLRGEPNLMTWMMGLAGQGVQCALPVVMIRQAPMLFKPWQEGAATVPGILNIPVPTTDATVIPDILLAPVVGFDRAGYRLGYGGGYFDRTLAAFQHRPAVIGIGFRQAEIPTIHPLPHDIGMDSIVTETGVVGPFGPPSRTIRETG